jgi:hypothetical protein
MEIVGEEHALFVFLFSLLRIYPKFCITPHADVQKRRKIGGIDWLRGFWEDWMEVADREGVW